MSIDFNGTTSIIGTPLTATLRPVLPITLAAWINQDTLTDNGVIQTNKTSTTHRGAWLDGRATGDLTCGYGDNTGNATADRRSKSAGAATLTASVWQHVAASIRGATDMTLYLNGADVGGAYTGGGAGMAYDAAVAGRIGALNGTAAFDGRIADIGFWNVSLSTAEILSMARGVSAKVVRPASLIVDWAMWDALNPNIDLSANSLELASLTAASAANHGPVGCPFPVAT